MTGSNRLTEHKVVAVGDGPHGHIGYANWLDQVWVLNGGGTTISVLDGTSGEPVGTLDVGGRPLHVILDEASGNGYVTVEEDTLAIISAKDGTITKVALPEGTGRSCLLPMLGRKRLYVVSENLPSVTVVDTGSDEVVGSFPVGAGATWGQPHGKTCGKLYISNADSDSVTIVDESTERVITTVSVGRRPTRAAIFREQGQVYTADDDGNTVTAIGIEDNSVRATVPVGVHPVRMVGMQKKTGRPELWVLNRGSQTQTPGLISVVDASRNVALEPVETVDSPTNWLMNGPIVQVVSSTGKQMMIIDSRSSSVVDTLSLSEPPDTASLSNMVFSECGNLFLANEGGTTTVLTPVD
jgi:YVTN family beta-propeller protein